MRPTKQRKILCLVGFVFFTSSAHAIIPVGKILRCALRLATGESENSNSFRDTLNTLGFEKHYNGYEGPAKGRLQLPPLKERLKLQEQLNAKMTDPAAHLSSEKIENELRNAGISLPESPNKKGILDSSFDSEADLKKILDFTPNVSVPEGARLVNEATVNYDSKTGEVIVKRHYDRVDINYRGPGIVYNNSKVLLPGRAVIGEFYPIEGHPDYTYQCIDLDTFRVIPTKDLANAKDLFDINKKVYERNLKETLSTALQNGSPPLEQNVTHSIADQTIESSDSKNKLDPYKRKARSIVIADDYLLRKNPDLLWQRLTTIKETNYLSEPHYALAPGPTPGSFRLMFLSNMANKNEIIERIIGANPEDYSIETIRERPFSSAGALMTLSAAEVVIRPR